jgi:hypothetical protein
MTHVRTHPSFYLDKHPDKVNDDWLIFSSEMTHVRTYPSNYLDTSFPGYKFMFYNDRFV